MIWRDFIDQAVGVPFVPHGRDYDGWDCWGLVWRAYLDVRGIRLPSYDAQYDQITDWRRLVRAFAAGVQEWVLTPTPSTGDVALIYRRGLAIHVGLIVPDRRILHVEEGVETTQELTAHMRVEGVYAYC